MSWRESWWPRWLCWLFGHEPLVQNSPERSDIRCLCGTVVLARERVLRKRPMRHWWPRTVGWIWRRLP